MPHPPTKCGDKTDGIYPFIYLFYVYSTFTESGVKQYVDIDVDANPTAEDIAIFSQHTIKYFVTFDPHTN